MHKIGFLIESLKTSQLSREIIHCCNNLDSSYLYTIHIDMIPTRCNFSIHPMEHAFDSQSIIVSTDRETTKFANKLFGVKKKFFYVYNLEWLYDVKSLKENMEIYQSDVELIVRSQEHFDIIKKLWKEPKHIIENFNHEEFAKISRENH